MLSLFSGFIYTAYCCIKLWECGEGVLDMFTPGHHVQELVLPCSAGFVVCSGSSFAVVTKSWLVMGFGLVWLAWDELHLVWRSDSIKCINTGISIPFHLPLQVMLLSLSCIARWYDSLSHHHCLWGSSWRVQHNGLRNLLCSTGNMWFIMKWARHMAKKFRKECQCMEVCSFSKIRTIKYCLSHTADWS